MSIIEFKNVTFRYDSDDEGVVLAPAVKDFSLTINEGEFMAVLGHNGSGKSTLAKLANGLLLPEKGDVIVSGMNTKNEDDDIKIKQTVGVVFQNPDNQIVATIVEEDVAFGPENLGIEPSEIRRRVDESLKIVGMYKYKDHEPHKLSGGQKQRVAIARALAMEPEIILLDEPTSALDPTMVGEVQAVIKDLARKGLTLMIVTHEMRFAREIANRVFYMDEGGVYEDGTPEDIFDNPKREKTIRFIKNLKVFENLITTKDFDFIGFNSSLEEFGRRNQVPQKTIYRAQSVFEELGVQCILSKLDNKFKLSVAFEYSQEEETLSMTMKYDGEPFDVRETPNIISYAIAENSSESIEYAKTVEDGFTNLVTVKIK